MKPNFKILGINHVAMAPKSASEANHFFTDVLGLNALGEEIVPEQKVKAHMFASAHAHNKHMPRLEVLDPHTFADSPIAKFLSKRGAGLHHLAITVDSIDKALQWMRQKHVKMIDETPRLGAHHTKIAFIHPHATGGLLIELVEQL